MTNLDVDLLVIGFGKGGKTLAAAMGRRGQRVALVEQSADMYGGYCINIGCVPTKSLIYRAEQDACGITDAEHYRDAVRATAALTATLRAQNLAMLEAIDTVTVVTGRARFLDATTVAVHTADGQHTISASTIVIGTGAEPVLPESLGVQIGPTIVTSTQLLAQERLPQRLVVLGGGYVGLEYAAMYAQYGSAVTVLEKGPRILGGEDDDVAACVLEILQKSGVTVIAEADVTGVDHDTNADGLPVAHVTYRHASSIVTTTGDTVLVALGRRPVTHDLGLDAAGIDTAPNESIVVDEHLRTNLSHVFAVGDVNGGPQFTYISLDDYRIVLDQLTGTGARSTADRTAVPYSLFITPPLSRVGSTERDARSTGRPILVATMAVADMATMPRAQIVDETRGLMKVIVDAQSDQILGAALLSYDSHEVINTVAMAIRHRITAGTLRDQIFTHPCMTEGFNQLLTGLR